MFDEKNICPLFVSLMDVTMIFIGPALPLQFWKHELVSTMMHIA
jgi:hypothetical protein